MGNDNYFYNAFYDVWEAVRRDKREPLYGLVAQYFRGEAAIDSLMISMFNDIVARNDVKGSLFEKKELCEEILEDQSSCLTEPAKFIADLFNLDIELHIFTYEEGKLRQDKVYYTDDVVPLAISQSQAADLSPTVHKSKKWMYKTSIKLFKYNDNYGCLYLRESDKSTIRGYDNSPRDIEKSKSLQDFYTIALPAGDAEKNRFPGEEEYVKADLFEVSLEETVKVRSDICQMCGKSKYGCVVGSVYGRKSVCPFCSFQTENPEIPQEAKEGYSPSKHEKELIEGLDEPNLVSPLDYARDEECLRCAQKVEYGFGRIKLPNCEHLIHKDCFEILWERVIYSKYQLEEQTVFERVSNLYTCQKCGSDIGLHFITYIYPWPMIMRSLLDRLSTNTKQQAEQMGKQGGQIEMKCCKKKASIPAVRNSLYNSLKTRRAYGLSCVHCSKSFECPLRRFLTPTEIRVITRLFCSRCKAVCLPFAFSNTGHSVCRQCFHSCRDRKYVDVFSGKAKISTFPSP